ncbi:hypothetical protein [Streptomyces mirabilis]|uniref:hypothetical protein n=1 Tax=Streptomyces mirabilis TaxID=68239 RepID=UPI0033A96C8D
MRYEPPKFLDGRSKSSTWAVRGLSAVVASAIVGALIASSAAAQGGVPTKIPNTLNKCQGERDFNVTVRDFDSSVQGTRWRTATDRKGNAYLNDSRNPGVWVNLNILPGAPKCVVDTAAANTESGGVAPERLYVTLLTEEGKAYEVVCSTSTTPFDASNLAAACGPGFTRILGTPVGR